ncbi:IS630 family transposase [Photorhabdus temperata]|nr:IS630 family transposase [Photorhabdus temperata]
MKIFITDEQKAELEHLHHTCRDKRECDRIRCVLLSADGWSPDMIARSQLIHETTVRRHLNDWLNEAKLKPENGGSQSHLSEAQTAELIAYLTDNPQPTTQAVIRVVEEGWESRYTIPGMNKWLHRHGLTYKKPAGIPHKFDAEKQRQFIEKYEELKQTASDHDPILFMDAVHPTQSTKLSYGWLRKGERKAVETTGSRTRMNTIGALNLNDIARTVTREYQQINNETVCQFFIAIRQTYPVSQKMHLILDGAPYHRTWLVQDWAFVMNIELHYLPPYSPNLNPIERLWKVMNEHVRNNRYFATAKDFRAAITGFFDRTLPAIAGELRHRINDNFQMLNPASSG